MLDKLITELTPEQEARIEPVRDMWIEIGLKLGPSNRAIAEEAIAEIYETAGLPPPTEIHWALSPHAGALKDIEISNEAEAAGHTVTDKDPMQYCGYGQHEAHWLAYYDFWDSECGLEACKPLRPYMKLAREAGWWWPRQGIVVISECPSILNLDEEGKLHSSDSKAIEYTDGWGVYAWHGMRVPATWITNINSIPISTAFEHENNEMRRVFCEIVGWEKVLEELDCTVITEGTHPIDGPYRLVEATIEGELARFLIVENPGDKRRSAIGVPLDCDNHLDAVAGSYQVPPELYKPRFRT